jgi:hypothetical protein
VHSFFLSIFIFVNFYIFRAAMDPSSGDTTVFMRHFVLVFLYGWLSGTQGGTNPVEQVWHEHSYISWWWAHSSPKHAEIDKYKYTKKNVFTNLVYLQEYTELQGQQKNKFQQVNNYVNKINFQNINNSLIKIFSVFKLLATALPTYQSLHLEHTYPRPVITYPIMCKLPCS